MRRHGRRWFTRSAGGALLAVGVPGRSARADGPYAVEIRLDRDRVAVGEPVRLIIDVSADGSGVPPEPRIPGPLQDTAAFDVDAPSVQSGSYTSIVNNRISQRTSRKYSFLVIPKKPGEYRLQTEVGDGAGRAKSRTARLVVTGEAQTQAQSPAKSTGKPQEPSGDIFLWSRVDRDGVYVGQQVTYDLELYERALLLGRPHVRTLPTYKDFWTEEIPEGRSRTEAVAGVPFSVHPMVRRALFPQRAGTLTIGGADAVIGLRRRITAPAVSVEVRPLPAKGQPAGFSPNNVGKYEMRASVDRDKVPQGEPLTLKVEIRGTGNVRFIDPGAWPDIEGVRRYDPKEDTQLDVSSVVGGVRSYSFLLIPQQAGELVIPAHRLDFFDPEAERYDTATTEPIRIQVEAAGGVPDPKGGAAQPAPTTGAESAGASSEGLLGIVAEADLPRTAPPSRWLDGRRWGVGMVIPPLAVAAGFVGRLAWSRFGPDQAARDRAALRLRRRTMLDEARAAAQSGEGFHPALARLVQDASVEVAGAAGVGQPRRTLMKLLRSGAVEDAVVDRIEAILEACDAARFGAGGDDAAARTALLDDAVNVLRKLPGGVL